MTSGNILKTSFAADAIVVGDEFFTETVKKNDTEAIHAGDIIGIKDSEAFVRFTATNAPQYCLSIALSDADEKSGTVLALVFGRANVNKILYDGKKAAEWDAGTKLDLQALLRRDGVYLVEGEK